MTETLKETLDRVTRDLKQTAGIVRHQRDDTALEQAATDIEALANTIREATTLSTRNPVGALTQLYPNAGKPWTNIDDEDLKRLFKSDHAIDDLAILFGRTPTAIRGRLERLGLVERKCTCENTAKFVDPRCPRHGAHEYHGDPCHRPDPNSAAQA